MCIHRSHGDQESLEENSLFEFEAFVQDFSDIGRLDAEWYSNESFFQDVFDIEITDNGARSTKKT